MDRISRRPACRAIDRANDHKQWVMTVKLFCAVSVMVRLAAICLAAGIAAGVLLGVQLAAL